MCVCICRYVCRYLHTYSFGIYGCYSYLYVIYDTMWYVIYDTTIHVYVDTLLAFMGLNLFSIPLFNCLKFT